MFSENISHFAAEGRSCFSFDELKRRVDSSPEALKAAISRLIKKGELAMPYRGFYVIVPPEYRSLGCRPAEQFIPELMAHLGEVYYAGLLSAAEYHGAAHHRPQVFQVVVAKPRRSIKCGKIKVAFIVKKNAKEMPVELRNTLTGVLKFSSAESTAFDLVGYFKQCGWLDNVATILVELAEMLDSQRLVSIAELVPVAWAQRLGYLLELIEAREIAQPLAGYVEKLRPVRTSLLSTVDIKGSKFDRRWRLFVNTEVEAEI